MHGEIKGRVSGHLDLREGLTLSGQLYSTCLKELNGGVESLLKYTVYLRIKYVQLYLTVYFKFQRHIFQRIQEKSTLVFSLLCVIMENNFIF